MSKAIYSDLTHMTLHFLYRFCSNGLHDFPFLRILKLVCLMAKRQLHMTYLHISTLVISYLGLSYATQTNPFEVLNLG